MVTGRLTRMMATIGAMAMLAGCSDSATPDDATGDGGGVDAAGDTPGSDSAGSDSAGGDAGSAVLTIGEETWTFDEFDCAFGHANTESAVYSFTSNSFGVHSGGARVQMQADIRDESGQGRYTGEDVIYEVYVTDIQDFENPSVDWESTNAENTPLVELGLAPPSGETVVNLDGDQITAQGFFDDKLTEGEFERVAGTLVGTCSSRSRF